MRSHIHKHRDMARSILPSTQRSARRDAQRARRRHRRAIRAELRGLTLALRASDDAWLDHPGDPTRRIDAEIRELMHRRRSADKLNHFERWAAAITRDLPREARLGHMRRVLPDGLIGSHAISHLERMPEMGADHRWTWWEVRVADREERRARSLARHEQVRVAALDLLENGDHAALNRELRSRCEHEGVAAELVRCPADIDRIVAGASEQVAMVRGWPMRAAALERLAAAVAAVSRARRPPDDGA